MDKEGAIPEERFKDFEEVFDGKGQPIGFTLPGNSFIFRYDAQGGWKDQKGNRYNSEGVLVQVADENEDEDESDEEILDQFERMLQEEEKPKQKQKKDKKITQAETLESSAKKYLEKYQNKQDIREGISGDLHIYFKMRSKFYKRIVPCVEKQQSVQGKNKKIEEIKLEAKKQTMELMEKDKWMAEPNVDVQFSGMKLDQNAYDRYWYGVAKANPQNFNKIIEDVQKSEEFALLESKTFHALKSMFYLKKKMKETIQNLQKELDGLEEDQLVKIIIDNLPEAFPCSLILDLCSFSDTPMEEIYSMTLVDDYSAEMVISKKGALKFLNVEGYCHDDGQFVQLEIEPEKQPRKLPKSNNYRIGLDNNDVYKIPEREIHDTLALLKSREQVIKIYTPEEEKENGGYRMIVGAKALNQVLRFRGDSLSVNKVELK